MKLIKTWDTIKYTPKKKKKATGTNRWKMYFRHLISLAGISFNIFSHFSKVNQNHETNSHESLEVSIDNTSDWGHNTEDTYLTTPQGDT